MKITDKYVFFWGGIYSNWYITEFKLKGVTFNCSEQYMMYEKALFFGDLNNAKKILKSNSPKEQKKLGREVKNFDADKWDRICKEKVYEACYAKFSQNKILNNQILLDGKNRCFVEASPYDKIWGIGMDENCKGVENRNNWKGKNYLGEVLNRVYKKLAEENVEKDLEDTYI